MDKFTLFIITMAVLVIAVTIHEYAHAKMADLCGDDTPRMQGRVTLSPFSHLDPMGTIFMAITAWYGYGMGWGRPVLTNHSRMNNPRWDPLWVALAGPFSNFVQASIFAIILRIMMISGPALGPSSGEFLVMFLFVGLYINLALCFFNLLPIGPLDGHWIVGAFMSDRTRHAWHAFNRGPGALIFLFLVLLPAPYNILQQAYGPVVEFFAAKMLGISVSV